MPSLHIALLGPLRVTIEDRLQRPPKRRDTERLWAYLLVHRGRVMDRAAVAAALWPGATDARFALRQSLHELRRHLPAAPDDAPWLLGDHATLGWNPAAGCWLDVEAFEQAMLSPAPAPPDPAALQAASDLYTGALLEGMDEPWLTAERERLDLLFLSGQETLVRAHLASADSAAALAAARRLVAHDPLREASQRLLIRLLAETGDRAAALAQLDACRAILAAELEVEPEPETAALDEALRGGRPVPTFGEMLASATTAAAVPLLPPAFAGALVGAERADELAGCLSLPGLITVTGPPGCGKSRLAAEAARRMQPELPGTSCWIDLAALEPGGDVAAAVAAALGDRNIGRSPIEAAITALTALPGGTPSLLVLDHVDRVVATCAACLREILPALPQLRVGVVSRERLGLGAERIWRVPPLALPAADQPLGSAHPPEAVALFLDLAEVYRPGLVLTPERAAAVRAIVRASEGLPELLTRAAAALAGRDLAALAAELADGDFAALDRTGPVSGLRHPSLSASVAWSETGLPVHQRTLFRRLAVFEGGFDGTRAEQVCAGDAGGGANVPAGEVLDLLDRLVAKSLVVADVNAPAGARHRLLGFLRWYGRARLAESGEGEAIGRRLAAVAG